MDFLSQKNLPGLIQKHFVDTVVTQTINKMNAEKIPILALSAA
jgi:hypothetical protein